MREEEPVRSVLDASALLAYLQGKACSQVVQAALAAGVVIRLGWPVVTADKMWDTLDVGVIVQLIRP